VSAASVERLRALCGGPRDGAMLRFALANALSSAGDAVAAIVELEHALALDPDYSAAWKLLGNARAAAGDPRGAGVAFERGIAAASGRGDLQAAREMSVLLRRLQRA
jgi:predicted Zn-dependent protease